MTAHNTRLALIATAFVGSLVIAFAGVTLFASRNTAIAPQPSSVGGPFKLVDQNGKPFTDADMKGKPTLVFFGFTHCPDICPTALFEVSEILRALGKDGDKAGALFVSVDPERDTPEKLKDYIGSFDPRLRALTGDTASVDAAAKAYRVYYRKVPTESGYTMDHTSIVYLMDKQGRFVAPFNLKRKPEEAAAELRRYF